MKSSALLTLVCAGLLTSAAYAQGNCTTPSQAPDSGSKPTIMRVDPKGAPGGANVTITGSNFKDVKKVMFNGNEAKFTVVSDSKIQATVPEGAKTGPIQIETASGSFRSMDLFQVGPTLH